MYKGKSIVAKHRNKDVNMAPTGRPSGLGRRKPHSGKYTRGTAPQDEKNATAVSNGLDKISLFLTGIKRNTSMNIASGNPFKGLLDKLLSQ